MAADLTHIDTWVFDLDNTLYPPECDLFALIDDRMTRFVMAELSLGWDAARALQKKYYHEHGTTLAGLMAHHDMAPRRFLDEVHDIALDRIGPDPALAAALARLPGRRLVYTNGSTRHAERVTAALGIDHLFDEIFDIEAAAFVPKPDPSAFAAMIAAHGVAHRSGAFFEDLAKNLAPAAALGLTTILVGPHAQDGAEDFVHHRALALTPFLETARVRA
jgi:putative hydrolase of the HAD superfamily